MGLFRELQLTENRQTAEKEKMATIRLIADTYNEWKKVNRRRNAVDMITASTNKLSKIDPAVVDHLHDAAKLKLATILMRCMDVPPWKTLDNKGKVYKKLGGLLQKMENYKPNTGTGGTLKEIVFTRLSVAIAHQDESNRDPKVFVCYEPKVPRRYLEFLFGEENVPEKTVRMNPLSFPTDFDALLRTLRVNHKKVASQTVKTRSGT